MNAICTAVFSLVVVISLAPRANADILSGLVAYFPFDGNADDSSGNGNHGQVFGAALIPDRFGHANSAYGFDGVDDYLQTLDSASLNITGDLTISAWIRTDSAENTPIIFSNMLEVSPHDGYSLRLTSEGTVFFMSGDLPLIGQSSVITGEWQHVAVVQTGTTASLYIDGALDISGIVGVPTTSAVDQTIGASYSPHYFWDGALDDVRVYNRALSLTEIQQLHAVPEPSSAALVTIGIVLLASARIKRRQAKLAN